MTVWQKDMDIVHPDDMHELGVRLGGLLRAGDLVLLSGELGAGKTTLTRGIGEGLGVRGPVTSPTFVLARTHPPSADGVALTHADAYRLGSAEELDDLDLDWDGSVVVIEWGTGMVSTGDNWLHITIERPTGDRHTTSASSWDTEDPVEPRRVHVDAYGDTWRERILL